MQALKNFGDYAVRTTEATADDEYQRTMLHKANTVAVEAEPFFLALAFALLAWVLPGYDSLYSVLVILPTVWAQLIAQSWLRNYAPRPRPRRLLSRANAPFFLLWIIGMGGIAHNAYGSSASATFGMIVGAAAATVALLVFGPRTAAKRRQQDEHRLDAQLED